MIRAIDALFRAVHRKRFYLVSVIYSLLCASNAANAQQLGSMQLAENLGVVIASEKFCNLEYNQDAISAFIAKHVREDDMSFAGMLQTMTEGTQIDLDKMSTSAKTAHCAQIVRVARSYGFIK